MKSNFLNFNKNKSIHFELTINRNIFGSVSSQRNKSDSIESEEPHFNRETNLEINSLSVDFIASGDYSDRFLPVCVKYRPRRITVDN